ncbi:hypothetical protein SCYAM73S_03194 [Streptomyces cyaneofuscatus]
MAKANSRTASLLSSAATPATMSEYASSSSGRSSSSERPSCTMTTGQFAIDAVARLLEPIISDRKPPSPREPTTTIDASRLSETRAAAGKSSGASVEGRDAGATSSLRRTASASSSSASCCPVSSSTFRVSGRTWTISSGRSRRAASRAAQSSACRLWVEPSTAAITGRS